MEILASVLITLFTCASVHAYKKRKHRSKNDSSKSPNSQTCSSKHFESAFVMTITKDDHTYYDGVNEASVNRGETRFSPFIHFERITSAINKPFGASFNLHQEFWHVMPIGSLCNYDKSCTVYYSKEAYMKKIGTVGQVFRAVAFVRRYDVDLTEINKKIIKSAMKNRVDLRCLYFVLDHWPKKHVPSPDNPYIMVPGNKVCTDRIDVYSYFPKTDEEKDKDTKVQAEYDRKKEEIEMGFA